MARTTHLDIVHAFDLQRCGALPLSRIVLQVNGAVDLMTDGVTHTHTHFCVSPRLPATAEKIEQWTKECLELAEQKVVLANEALVLVNANTKKLDKDIAKYKSIESNSKRRQASAAASGRMAAQSTGRGRKKNDGPDPPPIHYVPPTNAATAERYCYCRQISYGEMIGCDNQVNTTQTRLSLGSSIYSLPFQDCPIEWFHFPCMALETKPKGKWYCPKCLPMFKKQK